MKPLPKNKKLLLQRKPGSSLRASVDKLREAYNVAWAAHGVSTGSYPGPEPGKHLELPKVTTSDAQGMDTRSSKKAPKTSGGERRWRRKL
jgi:hypothetical protein